MCAWINADHVEVQVELPLLLKVRTGCTTHGGHRMDHEGRNMDNMSFTGLVTVERTVGIQCLTRTCCQEGGMDII